MKFFTYLLLAVSASALAVDPVIQGKRVVDRNVDQQVEAPRARNLAFEVRRYTERKANATASGSRSSQSRNKTARAFDRRAKSKSNKTSKASKAERRDGRAHLV
ncbi:hypothetical protein BJ170DRAFT_371926 [Xylariales sp. AK1849]|nr:hypothetical protein BJ170DRAFT_371926 [Xylariales sp. AK1849]